MSETTVRSARAPDILFDQGRHPRAKIGYVLLATEQTIQDDVYRLVPPGVGVHFTRVPIADRITLETLSGLSDHLAGAAACLLPDGSLDVICYACTSGSLVIGRDRVLRALREGAPGVTATSLITAVIEALRRVRARRIVVATPYLDEINEMERLTLEEASFEVLEIEGLNLERDSDMVRVSPDYLAAFARRLDRPEADAVFLSCGALRSLDIVERVEREIGKPFIVSNQALIWHTFRLAGIDDRIEGFGRLLRDH